jgi:cytoskeleton protein RodZ
VADSEQIAAASAGPSPAAQTVGGALRQARLTRDLSLEQVSAELRIETRQLDALEHDEFERIGVPVFVKGYIKQYGAFLGLDYRDLLAQYYQQNVLKEIQIQPSKTITLRDERQITVWIVALFVLAALAVAFAVWWMNGGTLPGSSPASDTQTSAEPAAAPVARPSVAASRRSEAVAATPASQPSSPPPGAIALAVAPEAAVAAPPLQRAPGPAPAPADAPTAPGAPAPGQTAVAHLDISFGQESWAEVSDARGQRLLYGMAAAGRNAKLSGEPPFAVVLGKSSGVTIALDGVEFPIPSSGRTGFARFSVDTAEE